MTKSFESYLKERFKENIQECFSNSFPAWRAYQSKSDIISYAEQWAKESAPIDPAVARKSLDCLTRYREALEELLDAYGHYNIKVDGKEYKATLKAKQALKEESERL